jgi:hypothetical protein
VVRLQAHLVLLALPVALVVLLEVPEEVRAVHADSLLQFLPYFYTEIMQQTVIINQVNE